MPTIRSLDALEILDSRGRPTVWCRCTLADSATGEASVPSGASTGAAEALELRDGDRSRYAGRGCRRAVANVRGELATHLCGRDWATQQQLDRAMIELDGTANKSRLGANAILAVSLAFARAEAASRGKPLFEHFASIAGRKATTLPNLTINLFSGGKHAGGQVEIQDVLLAPRSSSTIADGLAQVYAVYQAAADLTQSKYNTRPLRADEGGLAPPFASVQHMLEDAVTAIEKAGLKPGTDVALAVDVASSHFYEAGRYHIGGQALDSAAMVALIDRWVSTFPIISVEDGLAEDDWSNWPRLRETLRGRALTLGDDFLCTNPQRIERALAGGCADALLLKVNQIGSVSEALRSCQLAQQAGWSVTVSARSGETEDNWLADLAVGWGGHQIKIGSITQSERLAKYNRLLGIEAQTKLPIIAWPGEAAQVV